MDEEECVTELNHVVAARDKRIHFALQRFYGAHCTHTHITTWHCKYGVAALVLYCDSKVKIRPEPNMKEGNITYTLALMLYLHSIRFFFLSLIHLFKIERDFIVIFVATAAALTQATLPFWHKILCRCTHAVQR